MKQIIFATAMLIAITTNAFSAEDVCYMIKGADFSYKICAPADWKRIDYSKTETAFISSQNGLIIVSVKTLGESQYNKEKNDLNMLALTYKKNKETVLKSVANGVKIEKASERLLKATTATEGMTLSMNFNIDKGVAKGKKSKFYESVYFLIKGKKVFVIDGYWEEGIARSVLAAQVMNGFYIIGQK